MPTLLNQAIRQFTGCDDLTTAPPGNGLRLGNPAASVVVSLNPSDCTERDLAKQGYTTTRGFLALPSFESPRWLFPLGNGRYRFQGLEIYKPYKLTSRVLKGLLTTMVAARCQRLALPRLLIASRGCWPLEQLVREVTSEPQPVLAFSLGTEARFRKLTAQVMDPEGEILGYIKLPLTNAAVERVRHEAETLNRLWSFPALRPHIPRVLHSGVWGGGAVLFQSAGPPRPGSLQFGHHHEQFLQFLRAVRPTEKPGHVLWEQVASRWAKTEATLDSSWRTLGQAALARAGRELDGVTVPCGVLHGDFAPWNTRVGDEGLYVFDWESASWDAPILWDVFHFKTQVAALLNKKDDRHVPRDRRTGEVASFLLYLLSSACRLLGEDSPALSAGLAFRRELLVKQFEGR